MQELSTAFLMLSIFNLNFHSAWRFRSGAEARTQSTVARVNNSTFDLLKFWEPSEGSRSEERKREEEYRHFQKSTYNHGTSRNRDRSTIKFRGRYEEDGRKDMTRSRREIEPRSTRLTPLQKKQNQSSQISLLNTDDSYSPWLDFNPFSFKKTMEETLDDIPGTNITVEVIGQTVEYNDIVLCKIVPSKNRKSKYFRADEDKYVEEEPERKIILIVHGLSTMGFSLVPCLHNVHYFRKLVDIYIDHLDMFDIYLVPMANPDGAVDKTGRWNKNRSPQSACLGVALDRNFDVSWNQSHGTSCDQQYPGPEAFSEVESRTIADLMHLYSHKIIAYIHVHAGTHSASVFKGDAVLYPKGYTNLNSEDDKYVDLKGEIEDAIKTAGFKIMSVAVDTLYNWYGKVLGTSVDYASTVYGIPYALEFVMQVYEDAATESNEMVSNNVLTEIWAKVIGVVFENIHKNTQSNDV